MKCTFKIVLAVLFALILSCSSFAADSNRYVVLILDTSGSMWGQPMLVQKNAANKFCQQVITAQGNNHIALVAINTTASIICQFTNNLDELTAFIDKLYANGGTNIHGALQLAEGLLAEITANDAIKNIVLCSDGLPESGETQDGPYTDSDYSDYRYANAAYNIAQTLKQTNNIYTLGFFHSLYGEKLEFGRRFMQDLASNGAYYEVTEVEKLEFTFGEIAEDVVSDDNRVNTPIIIVPGIMGSRLFMNDSVFNEEQKAWDPIVTNDKGETDVVRTILEKIGVVIPVKLPVVGVVNVHFGILNQRLKLSSTVHVRPCENQNISLSSTNENNTVSQYGQEYGAQDAYLDLVKYLCSEYASGDKYRAVYFFSYDWRQSNTDSAAKLHSAIQNVLKETGAKKVHLVCHSMGGLVASKYFKEHSGDQQVDAIITCGTPYEGAPKLINSVMNWNVLGEGLWSNLAKALEESPEAESTINKIKDALMQSASDFFLGYLGQMDKSLKSSFMGVTELLPTENYINRIPMRKAKFNLLNWEDYNELSFSEYQEICRKVFSGYDAAYDFQDSLKAGDYNALLNYDKSYFILGINQRTITAVKYKIITNNINQLIYEDDLSYTNKGDGTVPYFSASICEQLNSFSFERVLPYPTDHGGVVKEPKCLKWIVSKINNQPSDISGSNVLSDGYIVVRIACPVDVTISSPNGEELHSSAENFLRTSSFGRLDVIGLSDDIKMACIDSSPNFSIVLNGTDTGTMDYDIRYFSSNDEIYKEDSFRNIPVTSGTVIKTGTDESKTTVLEVDDDGDGEIDYYLVPDSSRGTVNITHQPENQSVTAGEYAVFAVEASGSSLRYQWNINRHDGRGWTPITGATSAEYVSQPASLSDNGNEYHCLITDGEGHTVSTNAASLYVYYDNRTDNDDRSDDNNSDTAYSDLSKRNGGCEISGSLALMMLAGMFILRRKIVR